MSEAPASWSIVGAGNVGGSLIDMVAKPEVAERHNLQPAPDFVLRRDGWHQGSAQGEVVTHIQPHETPFSDVLFIATPSTPDHEPMLSMMRSQVYDSQRMVVTAEKGSLAENYEHFAVAHGKVFGYWATVGGGSKLVQKLELDAQDTSNIKELHLATNATLTYIFSGVASGESLDEVVNAAGKLGYAEPGATGVYDVIHQEAAGDVPRKTAIVLQTIFPEMVGLDLLKKMDTDLSEDQILEALNEADRYRYLVSVFPEHAGDQAERMGEGRLGGFMFEHEGWIVLGGFQRTDRTNALKRFNTVAGAGAGYYINLGPKDKSTIDGENFVVGTGAGGAVTANAMLDNYQALRQAA